MMDKPDHENGEHTSTVEENEGRIICTIEKCKFETPMYVNGTRYVSSSIQKAGQQHDWSRP